MTLGLTGLVAPFCLSTRFFFIIDLCLWLSNDQMTLYYSVLRTMLDIGTISVGKVGW